MSRPITVSAGPLVAATATGVSASQKAAGAQSLAINGSKSDVLATGVATVQTLSGAGNLTLDGTLVTGGVAYIRQPGGRQVYIVSSGNDSGITFTITGTIRGPTGITLAQSETVTGANTSLVCSTKYFSTVTQISGSGAAAANVSAGMNGLATFDVQRRVIITSGGNDTGITFALTGTNQSGNTISETITGANAGAASSVLDYYTVTSIVTSAAAATTVTVGTNGVAASTWVKFDDYAAMAAVSIQATVSGTANYTVQQTMQDPDSPTNAVAYSSVSWLSHPDSNLVGATTTVQGNYGYAPVYARVLLNSSSGTGSVSTVFRQAYTGG